MVDVATLAECLSLRLTFHLKRHFLSYVDEMATGKNQPSPASRTAALVVMILAVGLVCLVLYLLQRPALQVYWAIYARMKDGWRASSMRLLESV